MWYFHSRLRAVPLPSASRVFRSLRSISLLAWPSWGTSPSLLSQSLGCLWLRQWQRRLKKWIYALSNFIASVWTLSIWKMQELYQFLISRFKEGQGNRRRMFFHVLHKTSHLEISCRVCAVVCSGHQRNVLESVMHILSCCFAYKINCFLTLSPTFDKLIE